MKQRPFHAFLLALSTAFPATLAADETAVPGAALPDKNLGEKIPGFRLQALDGKEWSLEEQPGAKALVVVMLSTGCPMSNAYLETLGELARKRSAGGVAVVGINGNVGESREEIAAHAKEYSIPFPVLLDPEQKAVRALAAQVNSEVFVLDSGRVLRYRGRIDDGYSGRLKRNARVTSRDLEAALEAVVAGKAVATPATRALGCPIAPRKTGTFTRGEVTFTRDVAPILQNRCQECHRPGEVGPFSLLTYRDAVRWGEDLVEYTRTRKMPPWKPAAPEETFFRDPRRMPEAEIETLARWYAAGMPEGDPAHLPPPRKFPEGWQLGEPDLVLEVPGEMTIGASGKDLFRAFVIPTGVTEDRNVTAIEVRPGNKRVVHHTLNFVDTRGRGRKLEEAWVEKGKDRGQDQGPGYSVGMGVGFSPDGNLGGWAPGNLLRHLPEGVGYPLPANSDVVIQVHYHRTGKVEKDRLRLGFHFAKKPVTHRLRSVVAGGLLTVIPAGEDRFPVRGTIELTENATILQVTPHMHLLGKEIRAAAVRPDGSRQDLIWIRDWDYNWQETYAFREPLRLPAGTYIEVDAYYDNSEKNLLNPNQPPVPVTFGEETTNEMCFVFFGAISDKGSRIRYRPVLARRPRVEQTESAGEKKPGDQPEKKAEPRRASF